MRDTHEGSHTVGRRVSDVLASFMLVLAAVLVGLMALTAPFVTSFENDIRMDGVGPDTSELVSVADTGLFTVFALPALVAILLLAVYIGLSRRLRSLPWQPVAAISVAVIVVLGALWVTALRTDTFIYADSLRLDTYARALLTGDRDAFSANLGDGISYLQIYPFQSGSVWLLAGLYTLFGVGNQLPFQLLNVAAVGVAAASLIAITQLLFSSRAVTDTVSLLLVMFLPLPLSAALVYGNAIGFGLIALNVALNVAAMRATAHPRRRWALFGVSCVVLACALTIKSTFVLVLIALVLTWFIVLLRERRLLLMLAVLVGVLAANAVAGLPVAALEGAVGVDFGDGMPKTSWIAMGLEWSITLNRPGWWSPDFALHFAGVSGDADLQNAFALQHIGWSLATFLRDPAFALQFFSMKLMSEWLDPTFQSLYYSACGVSESTPALVRELIVCGRDLNGVVLVYLDGLQSLLYLAGVVGIACTIRYRRELPAAALLPIVSFLGGFACYLLWEAKSVYVLPFALLLMPFAAYGLSSVAGAVRACADDAAGFDVREASR